MLGGLTLNGYSLAALAIIVGGILILVSLLRRNRDVGISRYGFFIERERFDDLGDTGSDPWPHQHDTLELPPRDRS